MVARDANSITRFDFKPGRTLAGKYEVVELLGRGYEGEVFKVRELATGIERAAKFFYPERNLRDRAITYYAKKLNRLRSCSILITYLTHEQIRFRGQCIKFLISELVEGVMLDDFIRHQPGRRLTAFEGLHLLHSLAAGLEQVHQLKEYHGDLHAGNIMVKRRGIHFEVKLIDMYRWNAPTGENIREDVTDIVRVFYDCIGGRRFYSRQPQVVKSICCGLKRSLIRRKFRTAGQLRAYLETVDWDD